MAAKNDDKIAMSGEDVYEYPRVGPQYSDTGDFQDRTISVRDWFTDLFSDIPGQLLYYVKSLFPIATWIHRYNLTWFTGDIIAGLTVGAVVVPQSMSYALLAFMGPEYGLYSSFVGVFIYCFFATSKDVTIGPVAVMTLEVAKVITHVREIHGDTYSAPEIGSALALICGAISIGIGLLRIGFILEFIPAPAVAGFVTGSAFTIATTQIPALIGVQKLFNTRDASYMVIINTLKHLPNAKLDAAFGFTALFGLYFIRWVLNKLTKRYPQHKRKFFFANVTRNGVVVIIVTLASWLITRHDPKGHARITILKDVPRGFRHVGPLRIDTPLVQAIMPHIPVATIILLLEHISIGKAFGRINDYKINPNQEVIAIGATNIIGTFFGAYPATGSFSRTALKSKSGVRTPAAGIITGLVVILALYALTDAFYFIPMAGLAAVIIHAVGDLMTHPRQLVVFWRVQPIEAVIFLACVFIIVFTNVENGIYLATGASLALLLWRIARPRGQFLGKLQVSDGKNTKDVWVPIDRRTINPHVKVQNPPPGVIVFRPTESFTYPNATSQVDCVVDEVRRITKRGKQNAWPTLGDRPWNDPGPRSGISAEAARNDKRPVMRAVVIDFGSVATIDSTGIQSLVDARHQINKYADREVEFHFANIISPWVRRALISGGFGFGLPLKDFTEMAPVEPENSSYMGNSSRNGPDSNDLKYRLKNYVTNTDFKDKRFRTKDGYDINVEEKGVGEEEQTRWAALISNDTPFFHLEIPDLSVLPPDKREADADSDFGLEKVHEEEDLDDSKSV
ncbi:uncharacterized protein LAJ45_02275 [Morchella importuna]|uniref:uncharacterized protein n=1 Tax=Morchella importuna TaxID=1174673 RepID=UPI001E8E6DCE|nr:uncharacterized protein LAJ45_02275 [Morchella importuna]KAH8153462.1 hypothetical protein LAJ45_02275 [Morchella importuna]